MTHLMLPLCDYKEWWLLCSGASGKKMINVAFSCFTVKHPPPQLYVVNTEQGKCRRHQSMTETSVHHRKLNLLSPSPGTRQKPMSWSMTSLELPIPSSVASPTWSLRKPDSYRKTQIHQPHLHKARNSHQDTCSWPRQTGLTLLWLLLDGTQ